MTCKCFYKIFFTRKPWIKREFDYSNIRRRYRFFIFLLKNHFFKSSTRCSEHIGEVNDFYDQGVMILSDRSLEKTYRLYGKTKFPQIFEHKCHKAMEVRNFMLEHVIRGRNSCVQDKQFKEKEERIHQEQLCLQQDQNLFNDDRLMSISTNQLLQPGQFLINNDYYDESLKENISKPIDEDYTEMISSLNTPNVSPVRSSCWSSQYQLLLLEDFDKNNERNNITIDECKSPEDASTVKDESSVRHVDLFYSSDEEANNSQFNSESNRDCFISEDGSKHDYRRLLNTLMLLSNGLDRGSNESHIESSEQIYPNYPPSYGLSSLSNNGEELFIPPNQIAIPVIDSILRHQFVNRKTVWTVRWKNANGGTYLTKESTDSIYFATDVMKTYLNLLIDASPRSLYRILLVDKTIFSNFRQYLLIRLTEYPIQREI